MTRLLRPALAAVLLFAAGCTFERRPAAEEAGSGVDSAPSFATADSTAPDAPEPVIVERAEAFFRGFQEARRGGRISDVRSRLHPRVLLLHGSRRLSAEASDAELGRLLTLEGRQEAPPAMVEEIEPLASAVLFLVRYPPREPAAGSAVESVLLAHDSEGWSVRFLQRSVRVPD